MNASQISTLINEIYDGVNRSNVGPIYLELKDDDGTRRMNTLAYQTYIAILNSLFIKKFDINT